MESCKYRHPLKEICEGYAKYFFYWDASYRKLNWLPDFVCEKNGNCNTQLYKNELPETYQDRVLKDKPDQIKGDDFVQNLYDQIKADTKPRDTYKVLHIADPHIDLSYRVGTDKTCNRTEFVICCRDYVGFPEDKSKGASEAGEYDCDLPPSVMEILGQYVKNELEYDFTVFTGDITSHDTYNYTLAKTEAYTDYFGKWLDTYLKGTQVYPVLGNHVFEVPHSQQLNPVDPMITRS